MKQSFELTLIDGRARLQVLPQRVVLKLGGSDHASYDHAQQATDLALRAIGAATGRMKGDDADDAALGEAFRNGRLELSIRGHVRECRVAGLHLHARLSLDADAILSPSPRESTVRLVPIDDAPDGYATYRFDSDMRPLEAMRAFLERWLRESERDARAKEKAERSVKRWRGLLTLGTGESGRAPVRVVITGATGAGKSTFLNAVLGREVVPHSSGVCTATLLFLRRAASAAEEGFQITWRSAAEIAAAIASLEAEQKHRSSRRTKIHRTVTVPISAITETHDADEARLSDLFAKANALRQALSEAQAPPRKHKLAFLGNYARNAPSSMVEAVAKIDVFLNHPLLDHVEIVDAPGLRDGDDQRQRMLIRAFEGDAAWLYLVPADVRTNTCTADWAHIRSLAHNEAGVLVLTKADGQPADLTSSLSETMKSRLGDYQRYGWKRTREWCSALLPATLAEIGRNADDRILEQAFGNAKLGVMLGLRHAATNRLFAFAEERRTEQQMWQTFVDYSLDASRLPVALRKVGKTLYEDAIARRIEQGGGELEQAVKDAISHVTDASSQARAVLSAHDAIAEKRRQLPVIVDRLQEATERLAAARGRTATLFENISVHSAELRERFASIVGARTAELPGLFDSVFKRQAVDIYMSGARSFSLVEHFESPLSKSGHELLSNHARTTAQEIKSANSSTSTAEVLKNYVMMTFESVGNIADQEEFWEWESTTRARMWNNTQTSAARGAERLKSGFRKQLAEINEAAKAKLLEVEAVEAAHVQSLKATRDALLAEIEENNPAQSRSIAEVSLLALEEHQRAFEAFLSDLDAARKRWGTETWS